MRLPRRWFRRYRRLAGAIKAYHTELEHRICRGEGQTRKDMCWNKSAQELLANAKSALGNGNIDEGWKCFHAAQRMEIFGLTDEELRIRANVLQEESEKLSSWRKKATDKLIGHIGSQKGDVGPECVYQAALIRDEHYENQAYKDGLLRTHITILVLILFFLLIILPVLLWREWLPSSGDAFYPNLVWKMFCAVALFGLLGGTISAVLSVPGTTQSSRIPELTHTTRLTLLRVFVGAASAFIIYVFLSSQLREPLENWTFALFRLRLF